MCWEARPPSLTFDTNAVEMFKLVLENAKSWPAKTLHTLTADRSLISIMSFMALRYQIRASILWHARQILGRQTMEWILWASYLDANLSDVEFECSNNLKSN